MSRWITLATIFFLLYASLFFLKQPHITTLDLGRHLVNGREIMAHPAVLFTNYYSHTTPDFPAVNHHWLFGWLSWQLYTVGGFPLLVIANTSLAVAAIFLVFSVAKKSSSTKVALIASIICLPLLVNRTDIRPETISFFFMALWIFLLQRLSQKSIVKILPLLAVTQIIWVNVHLFFVFGWLIAGTFLLRSILVKKYRWQRLGLGLFFLVLPLISLINPSGIAGIVEPFIIFNNYSYPIAENQSLWFFLHYSPTNPYYWYASLLVVITIFSSVFLVFKRKFSHLPFAMLSIVLALITWQINRVGSFLGLALIPLLAIVLREVWQISGHRLKMFLQSSVGLMSASVVGFGMVIIIIWSQLFFPRFSVFGLTPPPNIRAAGQFFQSIETSGEIFNNYDIGSYLIFELFPYKRVFIDNRPEAYPTNFLKNDLIAAQESEDAWLEIVEKYSLGVIVFNYRDATDWAGPFIIRRVQDPYWVPIYADSEVVILVIDIPEHQEIIEKHRLPDDIFRF